MKMIAAVSKSWGLGQNGDLLFHIPGDMKFFRETTKGAVVVMGRKTLDSFPNGAPLKNRVNVVLTKDKDFCRDGVIVCHSREEVLETVKDYPEVFVIGGAMVYQLFLADCDTAYITKVEADASADTFLPDLDQNPQWKIADASETLEDNGFQYQFVKYVREGTLGALPRTPQAFEKA